MKKTLLIILLNVVGYQILNAQPKQGSELVDSLLNLLSGIKDKADTNKANLLISIARATISEPEKSIGYAEEALSVSEKLNFKKGRSNAYHTLGIANNTLGRIPEALQNYFAALKIREEIDDKKGIAGTSNNIGLIYMYQNNYPEALNMFFKALKINEEIDNKQWIAANYNNIGIIYLMQNQYPDALNNFNAALKMMDQLGDRQSQNHPYNNIGNIYFQQGKYSEALKNFTTALKIREEIGDSYEIAAAISNVGRANEMLGNFAEALQNYFTSLKIYNKLDDHDGKAAICVDIGNAKVKLKEFNSAKLYYDTAYAWSAKKKDLTGLKSYYEGMANLDSAQGNYKSSLINYKLSIQYRDSLVNDDNKKQLVQHQMQYDFDKKEATDKAKQDKKDLLAFEEAKRERNIRNLSFAGIAVLLLFSFVVIRQRNKVIKEKKRSDELLLNILPSETAEELKATGTAKAKDFDEVTVLFTDFKNFTAVSEKLNAQELVNEINFCYSAFDRIMDKYGIEKIKTIGDSYMCAGGLPVANKTNATDAVKAALEIRDFILLEKKKRESEGKTFFEIRIGLHTGAVVAGIVGIKKFAYDIWGDTVNIASRMESSGETGKVNISGSTFDLVKDTFSCIYRGKILAKNKGEVDMYFVESHS